MAGVRLGGLWFKKDQNGKEYLEGPFGTALIRVYTSDKKASENSPDATMYVVEKPKEGAPQRGGSPGGQEPRGGARSGGGHPYAPRNFAPQGKPAAKPSNPSNEGPPWPEDDFT